MKWRCSFVPSLRPSGILLHVQLLWPFLGSRQTAKPEPAGGQKVMEVLTASEASVALTLARKPERTSCSAPQRSKLHPSIAQQASFWSFVQTLTPFFWPPFISIPTARSCISHRAARSCIPSSWQRSLDGFKIGQNVFTDLLQGKRPPHTSILHKTASTSSQVKKKWCNFCPTVHVIPAFLFSSPCSSINSVECCCLSYFMCHWLPQSLQNVACMWMQKAPLRLLGCLEHDGITVDAGLCVWVRMDALLGGCVNAAAVFTHW